MEKEHISYNRNKTFRTVDTPGLCNNGYAGKKNEFPTMSFQKGFLTFSLALTRKSALITRSVYKTASGVYFQRERESPQEGKKKRAQGRKKGERFSKTIYEVSDTL